MVVNNQRVAVLIPCYNEAQTIARCVADFSAALPGALIYVYDNNSTDRSAENAREAGAIVRRETLQGKGNVVRRMFADVDADVYVLVDGDATYDASAAPVLVEAVCEGGNDMVVARRVAQGRDAYRRGHRFGNHVLTSILRAIFGAGFQDVLSGYRAFSRRFVKSFPALATGFETEVELAIHALGLRLPVAEIEVPYASRPEGSSSKLNTWRDGFRILLTIIHLFRSEKPLGFFLLIATVLAALGDPAFLGQCRQDARPNAAPAPSVPAIIDCRWGTVVARTILPTTTAFQHVHDARDHPPVINAPRSRLVRRQIRLDRRPSRIRQPEQSRHPKSLLQSGDFLNQPFTTKSRT